MDLIFGHYEQDPRKSELSAETSDKYRGAAVSIVTSLVGGSLNSSSLSGTDTIGKFYLADYRERYSWGSVSNFRYLNTSFLKIYGPYLSSR